MGFVSQSTGTAATIQVDSLDFDGTTDGPDQETAMAVGEETIATGAIQLYADDNTEVIKVKGGGTVMSTTEATAALTQTTTNVSTLDISTVAGSNAAMTVIDVALRQIDSERSALGAVQNRMEYTIANLSNVAENVSAARARIQDADFAAETAALTRGQILQQAGISMLAQANAQPQSVLALLQ